MDSRLHQTLIPVSHGPAQAIRRFNDQEIQKHIDAALADINGNGAILDVDLGPQDGVRAVLAAKLNGHWSIGMIGTFKSRQNWKAGLRVKRSFDW